MRYAFYPAIMACCLLVFVACKKDRPAAPAPQLPDSTQGVLIACEGSMGYGNAALSFFQEGKEAIADVYKAANGASIGDVLQSITRIENRLFLCVNNSDKILVIGAEDFKLQATISIPKPRYLLQVSESKAYVSTLFSNKIFVLNPATYTVTDTLYLPAQNPEEMVMRGNEIFVAAWDTASDKVFVVNPGTNALSRTLTVAGKAPKSMLEDKEGKLWVLGGNQADGAVATWSRLDPVTGELLSTYHFPASADPIRPVLNPTRDTLYWISVNQYGGTNDNGVYRMSIAATDLPATPFLPALAWQYFWALGIDPATGLIYVGDPRGFTQKGRVQVYQPDGTERFSFDVGVGPGHFYFQ